MSTRANIIIKDEYNKLCFYRHSDGYPGGTLPTLKKFLNWVKEGKIRDNVNQAAGWLILIGADEYKKDGKIICEPDKTSVSGWKCGAYEPTTDIHEDIEYLYIIDLVEKTIKVVEGDFEKYVRSPQ